MNPVISFSLKLFVGLGIIFGIHLFILHSLKAPLFENLIVAAYCANYVLAFIIYLTLYKLRIKHEHILGFVFMGGSFLKFAIFFIFFYPEYREDGIIYKLESTSFLIPYIFSLIIETYSLVKLLNKGL
jgi:hypothetical protein